MWDKAPIDNPLLLLDKRQRLQNLYYIADKNANQIPFNLNWAQDILYDKFWYQMLILKARQLGVTTFFAISFLDDCFWHPNTAAGIIADKRESAEDIFQKKVKFAYDRMPEWTKVYNSAKHDRVGELSFSNGSSFRVSTGFRSGTYQRLLVSEFGKICSQSPDVAKEIVTGSLNTVSKDQIVVIESTAEGREGYFYEYSREAEALALAKTKLSPMQFRFFFFPWWKEPGYKETNPDVVVRKETNEYLDKIEMDIERKISEDQRRWYDMKWRILGDAMKQEYPSIPKEAFESANEGLYYGQHITRARAEGRICRVPYQEYSPVHTAWDIGLDDFTSIWCFQLNLGGEIQVIDFYENWDEDALHYVDWLNSRGYRFGTHVMPHDAENRSIQTKKTYVDLIKPMLKGKFYVLEKDDPFTGIQQVRSILSKCVFDESRCIKGVNRLESYRKIWDDRLGAYKNTPFHDENSHAADAFRYLAMALPYLKGKPKELEDQSKALRKYFGEG